MSTTSNNNRVKPGTVEHALALMEKLAQKQAALERSRREPIAIVGMGCRFPGGAHNPAAYWDLLEQGRDAVTSLEARWSFLAVRPPDAPRWAGLLAQEEVEGFDAPFFEISDREADCLDPQQRLVLTVAWEALENAGVVPRSLNQSATGVFIGANGCEYERLFDRVPANERDPHMATGAMRSAVSGRLSYLLDLQGPSVTLDTACSSSLVAVHLAVQSLRSQECNLALAGGVNLILSAETMTALALTRSLSPDGRCRTFDAGANGFVRGEGCGVVVLKRLRDAERDGDRIWAVIRGSAVNQDGRSTGLTAPNVLAQQRLLKEALADAQAEAAHIDYVETHGTGTPLGDPIEFAALRAVLGQPRPTGTRCLLGAVKTNVGHLEAAAGVAGLIKTALALHHRKIPQSLNFRSMNPRIQVEGTPLAFASAAMVWPSSGRPGLAGVSAFGFSGTNAHVVLEEAPAVDRPSLPLTRIHAVPLLLSGRKPDAIAEQASRLKRHWEARPELSLEDVARSAALTRTHFEERAAIVAGDRTSALDALARFAEGAQPANAFRDTAQPRAEVALFLSGNTSGLEAACRVMYAAFATFRDSFDATSRVFDLELSRPLKQVLLEPGSANLLQQQTYAQAALFAFDVALFRVCESCGLSVSTVLGDSAGELAAAHIAGFLSLEDACRLIAARGRLSQSPDPKPDGLLRLARTVRAPCPALRWFSTVTGMKATAETLASESYWKDLIDGRLRRDEAVRALENGGNLLLLELGTATFAKCAPEDAIASQLSALHVRGAQIDWTAFFKQTGGRKVELPTYPFRTRRHWISSSTVVDPSWTYRRQWVRVEQSSEAVQSFGRALFVGAHGPHQRQLELTFGARATFCSTASDIEAVVFFADPNAGAHDTMAALNTLKGASARVYWVTQDCWCINDAQAVGPVSQVALWGIGLSCSVEHTESWGGLIDLPAGPLDGSTAERLLDVLSWRGTERQVAIRDGAIHVARLTRIPIAQEAKLPVLRAEAAYIVTGGLGGLGLRMATWLADRGARHLILMGRTALPQRRYWKDLAPSSRLARAAETVRELELRGVNVQTAAFDVADESAFSEWMSCYRDEQRPPIRGVVHTAGINEPRATTDITELDVARHLSPKLGGALALEDVLDGEPLDFFVMFSSAAALIPSPRLGAYAAANACLDALAERRRAAGQAALSVAWGPFAETGMLVEIALENGRLFQAMDLMNPDEAFDVMGRLSDGLPCVAVLPINWECWQTRYRWLLEDRFFEQFRTELPVVPIPAVATADVLGSMTMLFTELLGSSDRIDPDENLLTLGLDSLMAYDAQTSIAKGWNVEIPVRLLLKGASVRDIAGLVQLGMARTGEAPQWTVRPTMVEFPAKDGLTLYGHLTLPDGPGPHPAVVVHTGDQGGALDEQGRYIQLFEHAPLVSGGLAVLTLDQRGTPGHGEEYRKAADLGGKDVDDVLAAAEYLSRRPEIDAGRIALVGTCRGAYVGLLATQRVPEAFRAAVLRMGFYEPLEYVRGEKELRPETSPLKDVFPSWEAAIEFMGAPHRQPLNHISKVKTPLMLVHGEADRIVDARQSRALELAARNAGLDVQLRVVAKMGHDICELDTAWPGVWEEIRMFLSRHLATDTDRRVLTAAWDAEGSD